MQDNSDDKGTFGQNSGLTESEAEKLFEAVYNGEDVTKLTSTPPEPQEEQPKVEATETPAAPAEASTEKPSEETKGNDQVDPNANANPYAWVDSLTDPDMKAKVSQILSERFDLEHRWKSDNGRLRSAGQAVAQLRQEIEKLKTNNKPQEVEEQPKLAASKDVNIPDDPEWSKIAELDPQLARAVEKRAQAIVEARLQSLSPELGKIAERQAREAVAPFQQERARQQWEQEAAQLRAEVPDLDQIVASPQYQEYLDYYATPVIRELAANADSYSKAKTVLQNFRAYCIDRWGLPQQNQAKPVTPAVDTSVADKLAKEREAKLSHAVGPAATRQPTPAGEVKRGITTLEEQEQIFLAQWK